MTGTPIIEFEKVTLSYGGDDVIREASLRVLQAETRVILGPSGVGKSTILKAALGLIRPKRGRILIHGQDITDLPEQELVKVRSKMAMVFQNGALFDSMTVGQNVSFRLRELHLADRAHVEARVSKVLHFVGLRDAAGLHPAELSGGMKKRVAIARALAPDPECVLFDEPTVGLDPLNAFNVEQLILQLKKQWATIMIVTHDIGSALRLADSVLMLHEGRFIFEGPPAKLREQKDPRIRMFLDPSAEISMHQGGQG